MKILLSSTILALSTDERQPFYRLAFLKLSIHRKSICNKCSGTNTFQSLNCLTIGPYPLSKWALQRVSPSAFSFNFRYHLLSLRLYISCLRLLPCLPLTSLFSSIFPSITCFRWQFLHKMLPNQLTFLLFAERRTFLSSKTLLNKKYHRYTYRTLLQIFAVPFNYTIPPSRQISL
jgi:hypothetical protein